jgi:hypothetical protein
MKTVRLLPFLLLFCFSYVYADNTSDYIQGLKADNASKLSQDLYRDLNAYYGSKSSVLNKLLAPLTSDKEMVTMDGRSFNARISCGATEPEEIGVITLTDAGYGQANLTITQNGLDYNINAATKQYISGIHESGFITCNAGAWDDNCRYFKFSVTGRAISASEINDRTLIMGAQCHSAACGRNILSVSDRLLDQIVSGVNAADLTGTAYISKLPDEKVSLMYTNLIDCGAIPDNYKDISSKNPAQLRSSGDEAISGMLGSDNSSLSLAITGYEAALGGLPSSQSCVITNTPSFYLTCPSGYVKDYETKCSTELFIRSYGSANSKLEIDNGFQINTREKLTNGVIHNFKLLVKVSSPDYYGYDLSYTLKLYSGANLVYSKSDAANLFSPIIQIAEISLPFPEASQNYTAVITADGDGAHNFAFSISEYYELLSEDVSNFAINTDNGCLKYEHCTLEREEVCGVDASGCVTTKNTNNMSPASANVGIQKMEYTSDTGNKLTVTADGSKFTLYDDTKGNYAQKVTDSAWFYVKRDYFCKPGDIADNWTFKPNDLAAALGVVASADFGDGTYGYTDADGNIHKYTYGNDGACLVQLCTVEAKIINIDVFPTDNNTLRNDGAPTEYFKKEVRSCDTDMWTKEAVCPLYAPDDTVIIPCGCSDTALIANTAEALATINIIDSIMQNLTCSSAISK